jgi:hypothetical protein
MGPSFSEGVRAGADRHYVCAVEMSLLSGHKTLASVQLLGYRDVLLQGQVHHLNRVTCNSTACCIQRSWQPMMDASIIQISSDSN